ncbi:serine/threonine protein kinase [Trichormus variabilis ATCC 29413]|uniref:non-specific serine/threonine protein kinase n=2 Tax=Anabaena variabilis TaxID=264691 RepID=Q3M5M9_TRIV2|nr:MULTISPECIES: serine/threonine-protein kinase [Nostocaceae]ABA23707.1 serine/threonine protein kinase [Trichormus variabilis ATCC 29413]
MNNVLEMITEIEPGTLIYGRYQIQKLLGKGGFGRTYLALDNQRFDEPCVLKEFVPTASQEKNVCKSKELFEREAKVLYKLKHPQVPQFLAWFTDSDRTFIVQEYIDGRTYSEILFERVSETGQPFSEIEVRTWLTDVLPVLDYLHDRKIIHRDISLENIMLPHHQSKPVLIDFGAVKENVTQLMSPDSINFYNSIHTSVVGKYGYSPPEQLRLGISYPSSDIYALGVCAVVLLTGKMPHLLLDESLNWQWRSQVNIADDLAAIIDRMLIESPTARFQSAKEIILKLNKLHNNSPTVTQVEFKITSPIEAIKTRQQEKETNKALEELLILQNLERTLRQYHDKLPKPIYLNLDLPEYMEKHTTPASESSGCAFKKTSKIAAKIINIFTRRVNRHIVRKSEATNVNYIQINTHDFLEKTSINRNSQILEVIKKEFTNFIGPIANLIMNKVLVTFPDCSANQLIEILAASIPDKITAERFQNDTRKLIISNLYIVKTNE